jgi:NAD(P)H dehydrogenase (quinone)
MIFVTGATGNLGSNVVKQLLKNLSLDQFIVSSSNESGLAKLKQQGLQTRLANFNDLNTLSKAFKGVDKLLLISTMDANRFEQHKNVVDVAKSQGVKHIYYTSLAIQDIENSGVKDLMISHFQTEDYIKSCGVAYTILRNTMYADALNQILGPNGLNQDINLPAGKGKVPYALRSEIAEATANLLLKNEHKNVIYNITGSQAYSYADLAIEISKIASKEVIYNDISEESFIEGLKKINYPDFAIYLHAGTIADIKNNQYEIIEKTMEELLGRPTANAQQFLKEVFQLNQ